MSIPSSPSFLPHILAAPVNETNIPDAVYDVIEHYQQQILTPWLHASPAGSGEEREMAAFLIVDCLMRGSDELSLKSKGLTELPRVLPPVGFLDVSDNHLTALPELPDQTRQLIVNDNTQLKSLPEALPIDLFNLSAQNCGLTKLPDQLPASLQTLTISNNADLQELPATLPADLHFLYADDCALTQLPKVLPAHLNVLSAAGNCLESLPTQWPASLSVIDVSRCALSELPDKFPSIIDAQGKEQENFLELELLDLSHNQLSTLPEPLVHLSLPEVGMINVSDNPLSPEIKEKLTEINILSPFLFDFS